MGKGDGTSGRSYYCSKGCAGVSGGQVRNPYRFCNIEEAERYDTCVVGCEGASSSEENKGYCRYGCEFWTTPNPTPLPTPNPTPSIDLAWTTTTKYCAGKNKFRHCKAYPSYATEEWCIKFAKENGMMAVEYFVAYGNPTCQFYIEPWQTCGSFNIPGYYQTWLRMDVLLDLLYQILVTKYHLMVYATIIHHMNQNAAKRQRERSEKYIAPFIPHISSETSTSKENSRFFPC